LRFRPIQEKQKSRGVTTASLDFLVSIAQAVHNLLMLCDSPFFVLFCILMYSEVVEKVLFGTINFVGEMSVKIIIVLLFPSPTLFLRRRVGESGVEFDEKKPPLDWSVNRPKINRQHKKTPR